MRESRIIIRAGMAAIALIAAANVRAGEPKAADPDTVKLNIVGLYSPDREDDLRNAAKELEDAKLEKIDFEAAEVTFSYNPSGKSFKGMKPDQVRQALDGQIRRASNQTFSIKQLSATPPEKLQRVEFNAGLLDCKACCLGLYWAVTRMNGVERATVAKDGHVTAMIDPEKTSRASITDALKKREIRVKD